MARRGGFYLDSGTRTMKMGGFRGLYEDVAPDKRPPGVLKSVSNMVITGGSALTTSTGLTVLGGQGSGAINGLHVYRKMDGTEELLRHVGTTLEKWNGSAWSSVATGLPNARSTSANLNDVLAIFTGSTAKSWNGATLSNLAASAPTAKYVVEAFGKLFAANETGYEGYVFNTDTYLPTTWTPSATNYAEERQVSVVPLTWVGYDQVQGKVLIWTTREVLGYFGPESASLPALWETSPVSRYGTPCGQTVANLDGMWIWLTNNSEGRGFAMWSGGQSNVEEDAVASSFALIDWANIGNATAWTTKKRRYYCSVPKSGGGVMWFVYDPKTGWSVDNLADIRAAATFTILGEDTVLVGDANGYVYKVDGTTNNGTAIPWSFVLEFGGADAFGDKDCSEVRVLCKANTGATVSLSLSNDEGSTYDKTYTLSPGTRMTSLIVPMKAYKHQPLFTLKGSGTGVVTFYDMQFDMEGEDA